LLEEESFSNERQGENKIKKEDVFQSLINLLKKLFAMDVII